MDPVLSVSYATIATFLEAAEGNYRNAMYVSCTAATRANPNAAIFFLYPDMIAGPSSCPYRMRKFS